MRKSTQIIIAVVASFDGNEQTIGVMEFADKANARVAFDRMRKSRGFWLRTFERQGSEFILNKQLFAAETDAVTFDNLSL